MQKININRNWAFQDLTNSICKTVDLPHDAAIGTPRGKDGRTYFLNAGFKGIRCVYTKKLFIPQEYQGKALYLEFEGIYRDFIVYINGQEVLNKSFGYIPYEVRIDGYAAYGEDNEIRVEVNTPEENHNRWYAGSGIYQDVSLYVAEKQHIAFNGLRITTLSHEPARIAVDVDVENGVNTQTVIHILDGQQETASAEGTHAEIDIPGARLWDAEHPNLYQAYVELRTGGELLDTRTESFGIRTLAWSAEKGFLVNGKRTLLMGGCIHNDNGVIGTVTNLVTEERRIRNLKASGFNALRSAHHPMSPALLEMWDESFDTWYRMKQRNGFHLRFMEFYEDVTERMVRKDYNHPSVIMYSLGNEINEIGSLKGVRICSRMLDIVRSIDPARPTVLCPSMKMARHFLQDMPYAEMDEDEYLAQGPEFVKKDQEHYIWLYLKAISNNPSTKADPYPIAVQEEDEAVTLPLYQKLDIAGYNYYSDKFEILHQRHPERLLLGTETRGHLICPNWKFIQEHPYAIGDFIWTLQDHIGEANVGGRSYGGGAGDGHADRYEGRDYPWLLNDGGVIDLLGHILPAIHKYRMCWGEERGIFLASQPPVHNGIAPHYTSYKWTDSISSWSYEGFEGQPTFIDVYSDAFEVEVLVNGKTLSRQRPEEYFCKFPCTYEPGEIIAVGYDISGAELYRTAMRSAGKETEIRVAADKAVLKAGTQDFCFLNIDITDGAGIIKALPERELTIHVDGAATLQGFGSADPVTEESYCDNVHHTYHGRALAVLRSGENPGPVAVTVRAEGLPDTVLHLETK